MSECIRSDRVLVHVQVLLIVHIDNLTLDFKLVPSIATLLENSREADVCAMRMHRKRTRTTLFELQTR